MLMPWQQSEISEEKFKFILDWKKNEFTISSLCNRYKISRPTAYKLIKEYSERGMFAFQEKSSAPHTIPHKTDEEITQQLIELKYRFPNWGPAKIKDFIIAEGIQGNWPAASTIGDIYKRHGLVKPRKKTRRAAPHSEPLKHASHSNAVWSADFKGQFRLSNGKYCYPLTITDNFSRYLFACDGFLSPSCNNTIKSFEKVFAEYGLPDAIRTDNGQPFCGVNATGLTRLTIWFLKLGIGPERIALGAPQENGRHERMHRTLKQDAIIARENTLHEQQLKFNNFIHEYNNLRPHQALNGKRPKEIYQQSKRQLPEKLSEVCYPAEFLLRKVKHNGEMKFAGGRYHLSELLHGEVVGLEMIDEHRAIVYFGKMKLGLVDPKLNKIIRPF